MYNPNLASIIGLSLVDIIILVIYLIASFRFASENSFSDNVLIGILFLLIKVSMNYYQAFYIASILFIFIVFQSLFRPSEDLLSSKLMILVSLIIISNVLFYFFPVMIIAETRNPIKPNDIVFGAIGGLIVLIFLLDALVNSIKNRRIESNVINGFIFLFYFAAVISIAVITGFISHLIYGLAIQLFSILLYKRLDRKSFHRIYIFGLLLTVDNIVGFLVYPEFSPFPQPITSIISSVATIIMLLIFIKHL